MTASTSPTDRRDGGLWAIALGLSLLVNLGGLSMIGFLSLRSPLFRHPLPVTPPTTTETRVTIFPDMIQALPSPEPTPVAPAKPVFVRTAADQLAVAPVKSTFLGERNTQATRDRPRDPTGPALPSQAGIQPRDGENLETTTSDYQDGELADTPPNSRSPQDAPPLPVTEQPSEAAPTRSIPSGETSEIPESDAKPSAGARERLAEGPNPVDVAMPRDTAEIDDLPTAPPKRLKEEGLPNAKVADLPKPTITRPNTAPAFRGNQRKTAMIGSISRSGRSALDVADSPLGRYQAVISRAVEQEWQRNCVRHRDFITPGFLTVRFFVETSGRVRTVQFVGNMETGEVQKGFTLNAIRDARIPSMPNALKEDFANEPLELIFNFYF